MAFLSYFYRTYVRLLFTGTVAPILLDIGESSDISSVCPIIEVASKWPPSGLQVASKWPPSGLYLLFLTGTVYMFKGNSKCLLVLQAQRDVKSVGKTT